MLPFHPTKPPSKPPQTPKEHTSCLSSSLPPSSTVTQLSMKGTLFTEVVPAGPSTVSNYKRSHCTAVNIYLRDINTALCDLATNAPSPTVRMFSLGPGNQCGDPFLLILVSESHFALPQRYTRTRCPGSAPPAVT